MKRCLYALVSLVGISLVTSYLLPYLIPDMILDKQDLILDKQEKRTKPNNK